jgi:hypothetical protein
MYYYNHTEANNQSEKIMSNIIDYIDFTKGNDITYITGQHNEPNIVGVRCKNISIQLSVDLHNVLLGDVEIKREELIAFILSTLL